MDTESAHKANSGEKQFSCQDLNSQPFDLKSGALPTSYPDCGAVGGWGGGRYIHIEVTRYQKNSSRAAVCTMTSTNRQRLPSFLSPSTQDSPPHKLLTKLTCMMTGPHWQKSQSPLVSQHFGLTLTSAAFKTVEPLLKHHPRRGGP